jgi:hypothetical protein
VVDARVYKLGIEVLAESPIRVGVTKQSAEVISQHAATSDAAVRVYKHGIEVLRKTPEKIDVTKQSVEVLGQFSANAAEAQIFKLGLEILIRNLKVLQVTKQSAEVIAQNKANSAQVNIAKFGVEVLFRSGPLLDGPAALPAYYDIFANNWAQEVTMDTAYDTDVSRASSSLTEDRRGLRDRPYRTLNFRWTAMVRASVDRLLIFLRKLTEEGFPMLLYQDITEVSTFSESGLGKTTLYCDTTKTRFFANQRIAVVQLGDDLLPVGSQLYEIDEVEIDHLVLKTDLTVDASPVTSVIFPCFDAEIQMDPQISFSTNYVANVNLSIREKTASTALPPVWTGDPEDVQFYDGIPVFSWEPNWNTPPQITWKREGSLQTKGRGTEPYKQGDRYRALHHYMIGETRESFWNYLKFFDSRRGRKRSFWHIDAEDIWEVSNVNGVFLEIVKFGDFTELQDDFDYVGVITKDGQYYVRKVVTIQEVLGVYRLTLDAALPVMPASDVRRVSRARLSRYMKDVMNEHWKGNQYVQIPIDIFELLEENDVEMT